MSLERQGRAARNGQLASFGLSQAIDAGLVTSCKCLCQQCVHFLIGGHHGHIASKVSHRLVGYLLRDSGSLQVCLVVPITACAAAGPKTLHVGASRTDWTCVSSRCVRRCSAAACRPPRRLARFESGCSLPWSLCTVLYRGSPPLHDRCNWPVGANTKSWRQATEDSADSGRLTLRDGCSGCREMQER